MLGDAPAMRVDLGCLGVFFGGDVAQLLEHRHVDVGFDVAGRPRITVPIPGAAKIAALLDDAQPLDAGFAQAARGEQAAETAADDQDVGLLDDRRAGEVRIGPGIDVVIGEAARQFGILVRSVGPPALVAFGRISRFQCCDINFLQIFTHNYSLT